MEYTIAAIPTLYNGRRHRSRLEAKWAAFFDLIKWRAEYEPVDLGKWSPDFLVTTPVGAEYFVEVKPITSFDPDIGERIISSVRLEADNLEGSQETFRGVYLLGISPFLALDGRAVCIGWINPFANGKFQGWRENYVIHIVHSRVPAFAVLTCKEDCVFGTGAHTFPDYTMGLWAEASNSAQWSPKDDAQ